MPGAIVLSGLNTSIGREKDRQRARNINRSLKTLRERIKKHNAILKRRLKTRQVPKTRRSKRYR